MSEIGAIDTESSIGVWLGGLMAVPVFLGAWIYCMSEYGFLFGFGLGWLPAGILGSMVFGVVRYLWPTLLFCIGIIILLIIGSNYKA